MNKLVRCFLMWEELRFSDFFCRKYIFHYKSQYLCDIFGIPKIIYDSNDEET